MVLLWRVNVRPFVLIALVVLVKLTQSTWAMSLNWPKGESMMNVTLPWYWPEDDIKRLEQSGITVTLTAADPTLPRDGEEDEGEFLIRTR